MQYQHCNMIWLKSFLSRWFSEHPGLLTVFCGPKPALLFPFVTLADQNCLLNSFSNGNVISNKIILYNLNTTCPYMTLKHFWHFPKEGKERKLAHNISIQIFSFSCACISLTIIKCYTRARIWVWSVLLWMQRNIQKGIWSSEFTLSE